MTLKLPLPLLHSVENEARRRGIPKAALVRECVETVLQRQQHRKPVNCLYLVSDLVGSQPGPQDASTNPRHLEGALVADYARSRKKSR